MALVNLLCADALRTALSELLRGFGSQPREIELVANNLIGANLAGHDSRHPG